MEIFLEKNSSLIIVNTDNLDKLYCIIDAKTQEIFKYYQSLREHWKNKRSNDKGIYEEKQGQVCIHGSNPQEKVIAHFEWQRLPPRL